MPAQKAAASVSFASRSEAETHRIAAVVSTTVEAGDVLLLWGDVGTGKSAFARGFLRALCGQADLVVPSPTFTLMRDYRRGELTSV